MQTMELNVYTLDVYCYVINLNWNINRVNHENDLMVSEGGGDSFWDIYSRPVQIEL